MRNKIALAAGIAALVYAASAFARPPIADELGEFYVYFDAAGNQVGSTSLDCDGNFSQSGALSPRYSSGYAFCPGD